MRLIRLTAEHITRSLAGGSPLAAGLAGGTALSLGSFDGLHRGHQALIRQVLDARERHRLAASCLFTFRRHPRLVLDPAAEPFLLTTWREKLSLLAQTDLDAVVAADFCPALSRLSYPDFVRRFLVDFLGLKHFVAGYDVHLGRGREGTAETLAQLGRQLGYGFEVVPALREDGRIISSSAIRDALAAGRCEPAAAALGRSYAVWGEVGPGDGRGRTIGFATANVTPLDAHKLLPAPGVYAVRVQVPVEAVRQCPAGAVLGRVVECLPETDRNGDILSTDSSTWAVLGGMLNFGRVPTFHGDGLPAPRIEVHLFGFAGDLRGRCVKVDWVTRLRQERKFDSVPQLVQQLRRDEIQARQALSLH